MRFLAFAAAFLLAAPPVLAAQQQRARPRADARTVEADRDDDVYLPGLTEPAGAETAADMAASRARAGRSRPPTRPARAR